MTDHNDTDYHGQADRFPLPDPEQGDPDASEFDNDYEWAEYNLPVFPSARLHLSEEAGDEPDFIGLVIDMDHQLPGNS